MKFLLKSKRPNLEVLSKAFFKIADSIVPIITIGFYWTDFEYRFTKYLMFRKYK